MKKLFTILFFSLSLATSAQSPQWFFATSPAVRAADAGESTAQRIVNNYATLAGINETQKQAVKDAITAIDDAGFFSKILAFNIPAFSTSSKSFNVVNPVDLPGAFTLTVNAGSPTFGSSGVTLAGSTQKLTTHFINDQATNAPNIGAWWYSSVGIDHEIITGTSPFRIEARFGGKAYVNIWGGPSGVTVPASPAGFSGGQRVNSTTVNFFQGTTKYTESVSLNSSSPSGNETLVQGGATTFTLKVLVIAEALTDTEEATLKSIIDQLITDLGL